MQDLALVSLLRAQHVKKRQELNLNYLIYLTCYILHGLITRIKI